MSDRWSDAQLEAMRKVGDPQADAVIQSIFASNQTGIVNTVMRSFVENDQPPPGSLPPEVHRYLDETALLPAWTDPQKIQLGERVFLRFGPQVIVVLHCYALPFCYAGAKGVQVLHRTSRLYTNAQRRILETAQMIMDVMSPGGMAPNGHGVRSAQKVRLMHAAVRHLLLKDPAGWNLEELGVPINQEDLAGTLMAFSWVTLDGLRRMGIALSAEESEAYLHVWRVVGHVLGIREDMLPVDMADAEALTHAIQRRQYAPCLEGKEMMQALLQMMAYQIPGNLFDNLPASLIRYFLGDPVGEILGVPMKDWTQAFITPLRFLGKLADAADDHIRQVARLSEIFGHQLLNGIVWINRGGKRPRFYIPTELRQVWNVNWLE